MNVTTILVTLGLIEMLDYCVSLLYNLSMCQS